MKMNFSKGAVIFLLTFLSQLSPVGASVGTRGGGNTNAAEFAEMAEYSILKISLLKPVYINSFEIDGSRLKTKFNKTKIYAVSRNLKLNGKPVYAINNPQKLEIYFNEN